jgi:ribosomal protein S6
MANYEIMLVVNGSMSNEQAQESVKELTTIVDKLENYKFTNVGNLNISYRIKGQNMG